MKKFVKIVSLCAVFCLVLTCFLVPTKTSYAVSNEGVEATVYGTATKTYTADSAEIFVRIENADTELTLAKEKSLNQFEALKNTITNADVKIDSFYTNPNIDYSCDKQIVGYYAILSCVVEVDSLENMENVVNVITENNACINYINLKLSNADEIYLDCLVEAKKNAIDNAKRLLETENVNVLEIEEEGRFYSPTKYMKAENVLQENFSYEIEISATVSLKCETL